MKNEPLVTIWCTCFNHKDYIEDAIQGFLNQRTSFDFEILIHDDCSTDGTIEILKDYEERYPEKIHVLYEKENSYQKRKKLGKEERIVYIKGVLNDYKKKMHGKYLAICEGDDFWIDPNKLQIQVSYMEEHGDCILTGTNGMQLDCRINKMVPMSAFDTEKDLSMEEILLHKKMNFPTASIVMKKEIYFVGSPFFECRTSDWMWQIRASIEGVVHYFDRVTAVYRYFHSGSWSANTYDGGKIYIAHMIDLIRFFDRLNEFTKKQYESQIKTMIEGYYYAAAMRYIDLEVTNDRNFIEEVYEGLNFYEDEYGKNLLKMKGKAYKEKSEIIDFCKKYSKVFIMGTGDGAHVLCQRLKRWKVEYVGHVVSNDQPLKAEYAGKKVLHLNELNVDENVGIIIGIQRKLENEIMKSLDEAKIWNYIWASV